MANTIMPYSPGGSPPRIIYDYACIGINAAVLHQAPIEAMQFSQKILRLLRTILNTKPWIGSIFMSKMDLSDAYMRVWIRSEDLQRLAFVVPLHLSDHDTLISFHIYLMMSYVDSDP